MMSSLHESRDTSLTFSIPDKHATFKHDIIVTKFYAKKNKKMSNRRLSNRSNLLSWKYFTFHAAMHRRAWAKNKWTLHVNSHLKGIITKKCGDMQNKSIRERKDVSLLPTLLVYLIYFSICIAKVEWIMAMTSRKKHTVTLYLMRNR